MKVTDKINITNEDNMELMARYPDNYFELAIVDPPYGIDVNVNMGRRKGDKSSDYHKFAGEDSSIPSSEYFKELKRVGKNQIIWGGNYMTEYLNPSPCWLFWDKGFSEDVTFAQFEMAWNSFSSSAKKYQSNAAANRNRIHPTQKPVKLYEWLLMRYAKELDCENEHCDNGVTDLVYGEKSHCLICEGTGKIKPKILDTHLGSGSIAIACHNLGFELTACELDKEYYDKAIERIKNHISQQRLF
jgi:site-specific DNA-methyltransferase (adenine-specific)